MNSLITGFLLLSLFVFQHFTLIHVGSYELTLGTVAGLLLLLVLIRRTSYPVTTAAWSVIITLSGIAAILGGYNSGSSYLSTLMLFLLTSAVVCSSFGRTRYQVIESRAFKNVALITLALVVTLSIAQVSTGKAGSDAFYNVFGSRQYLHTYNPLIGLVDFPRAQGFYLEPSYNAFVIGSLTVLLITLQYRIRMALLLGITGLLVTQSATALILLVFMVLIYLFKAKGYPRFIAALTIAAVLLFSGSYLLLRLSTIGTVGTSANYRILAPIQILGDILGSHPLGMPLGSVQETVASYDLFMAGMPASSLDNGYYILIYYFGWFGLAAVLIMSMVTVASILAFRHSSGDVWVAKTWMFGSFAFSGAIMAPEFGLTLALLIIGIRTKRTAEAPDKSTQAIVVNHHGDIQRLPRTSAKPNLHRGASR